jgi:hypothetical protein
MVTATFCEVFLGCDGPLKIRLDHSMGAGHPNGLERSAPSPLGLLDWLLETLQPKQGCKKASLNLVFPAGFEPTAPRLGIWCSIRLSYGNPQAP